MKKILYSLIFGALLIQACTLSPEQSTFPTELRGTWQETDYYDTFEFNASTMIYYSFDDNEYYTFSLKSIDENVQRFILSDSSGDPWEINYWFDDSLLVLSWSDENGFDVTVFMEKK